VVLPEPVPPAIPISNISILKKIDHKDTEIFG
jgi:hypothetical protein